MQRIHGRVAHSQRLLSFLTEPLSSGIFSGDVEDFNKVAERARLIGRVDAGLEDAMSDAGESRSSGLGVKISGNALATSANRS